MRVIVDFQSTTGVSPHDSVVDLAVGLQLIYCLCLVMNNRIMGQPRFAGEAILDNPQMGLLRDRGSIQANQAPGGTFEETRTEKFFQRPQ